MLTVRPFRSSNAACLQLLVVFSISWTMGSTCPVCSRTPLRRETQRRQLGARRNPVGRPNSSLTISTKLPPFRPKLHDVASRCTQSTVRLHETSQRLLIFDETLLIHRTTETKSVKRKPQIHSREVILVMSSLLTKGPNTVTKYASNKIDKVKL